MEIRQLKYFLSAVELGSVGAAALAHFVTQPAVSTQIKRLEEEVGQVLLLRSSRGTQPTPAGLLLADHARAVVQSVDRLENVFHDMKELQLGTIRLGCIDAASIYVLPDIYRAFHRKFPQIKFEISVGDTRALIESLTLGRIDLATTTLPVDVDGLEALPIYREELVPVVAPSDPLAARRKLSLATIAEEGVITYPEGSTTRRLIEDVFAGAGLTMRTTMEISSPEAMKRLAQAGLGITILPLPVVSAEISRRSLKRLNIGVKFERLIGMVARGQASLPPAAAAFLSMVKRRYHSVE